MISLFVATSLFGQTSGILIWFLTVMILLIVLDGEREMEDMGRVAIFVRNKVRTK